jgi:hypothetical protein
VDISPTGSTGTEHLPADLADPASWAAVEAHLTAQLGGFEGSRAVFIHVADGPQDASTAAGGTAHRHAVLLRSGAPQALGHAFLAAAQSFDGAAHLLVLTTAPAVQLWVQTAGREQSSRFSAAHVLACDLGADPSEDVERTATKVWALLGGDHGNGTVVDPRTLDAT